MVRKSRKIKRPRNPYAVLARRRGLKVERSPKQYRRREKHKQKPETKAEE